MPSYLTSVGGAVAALAAVLGLVLLAGRLAKGAGWARPGPGRRLALQESLSLDRTRRLHIVRCDGREVLLLTGGASDLVAGWLPLAGKPLIQDVTARESVA